MELIYETKGKAGEYAPLGADLYSGCLHRCAYCYVPEAENVSAYQFHHQALPRPDTLRRFCTDLDELDTRRDNRLILLSFGCDPYPPAPHDSSLTRAVLEQLQQRNRPYTVLTKGGTRAVRDFDILENSRGASFGTTLVFMDQATADAWEPGAASLADRIAAVETAHQRGIATWVSMEPVVVPDQAIDLVRRYHAIVDHWKVGKINYCPEVEEKIDWRRFREDVTRTFHSVGANFHLKKSLTEL